MNTASRAHQADHPVASEIDPDTNPGRLLSCMAGFYRSEVQARAALRQVQRTQGLLPAQSMLLSPDDASFLRFTRISRAWASERGSEGPRSLTEGWVAGAAGAALAILACLAWLGMEILPLDNWQGLVQLTALGLVGLLGVALLALGVFWTMTRPVHRFDQQVRRQLGLGYWALVAHRVPWAEQAGVVTLLRSTSRRWCAAAPHSQRL